MVKKPGEHLHARMVVDFSTLTQINFFGQNFGITKNNNNVSNQTKNLVLRMND